MTPPNFSDNNRQIFRGIITVFVINAIISALSGLLIGLNSGNISTFFPAFLRGCLAGFLLTGIVQWLYIIPLLIVLGSQRRTFLLIGYLLGGTIMSLLAFGGCFISLN